MTKDIPLVTICCTTFNHKAFIKECLDGFIMQKTTFPIEIIVHDDASKDGTTEIVKNYEKLHPHLFNNIYQKENQWSQGVKPSPTFVWPKARGKYIALCEGDDFWTDPLKLQKQVDFLENNKEYSLCFTNKKNYFQATKEYQDITIGMLDFSLIDFQYKNENKLCLSTCTCMFETKILKSIDYNKFLRYVKNLPALDTFLMSLVLTNGRGIVLEDVTAIYRVTGLGASSNFNSSSWSIIRIATLKFLLKERLLHDPKVKKQIRDRLFKIWLNYLKSTVNNIFKK